MRYRGSGRLPPTSACRTRGSIVRIGQAEKATAATGPAHLRCARARRECAAISVSIMGVVTPGASSLRASHSRLMCSGDTGPVAATQCVAHAAGGVRNPFEAVEHMAVSVDVPFHDFPVVRARKMGRAGVRKHDAALQRLGIDVDRRAPDAVRQQFDGGHAAVIGRPVVLKARRHVDHLGFDVHRNRQQLLAVQVHAAPRRRKRRRPRR